MCLSCICLFVLHVLVFVLFSSSWYLGLAVVCDCGTPWIFSFNLFHSNLAGSVSSVEFASAWHELHSFVEVGHEIISTAILSLPLIKLEQLSVTGEHSYRSPFQNLFDSTIRGTGFYLSSFTYEGKVNVLLSGSRKGKLDGESGSKFGHWGCWLCRASFLWERSSTF